MLPPTAAGSDQVGTKDFEFDVSADAARQIQAQIDGVDGDDYDLYLYKGTKSADNVVASSTSGTADEIIAYDYPQPGHYILSVQNWLATGGWTGTLKVFGSVPGLRGDRARRDRGLDRHLHAAERQARAQRADRHRPRSAQGRDRLPQERKAAEVERCS